MSHRQIFWKIKTLDEGFTNKILWDSTYDFKKIRCWKNVNL